MDQRTRIPGVWLAVGLAGAMWAAAGCADRPTDDPVALDPMGPPEWTLWRGDQAQSGVARGALPDELALLWRVKVGWGVYSSPVVRDGRVYVADAGGKVFALDLDKGTEIWSSEPGDSIDAPLMLLNDVVYAASGDGCLYALHASDGQVKWTFETQDEILGGAGWYRAADGAYRIFIGSYDYMFYCLDEATGEEVWSVQAGDYINGSPAVVDGKVLFGGCDQVLHVVDAETGEEGEGLYNWSYLAASPAVVDGVAYIGDMSDEEEGRFGAADIETGEMLWEFEGEGEFFSSPAVSGNRVVVGCRDYRVYAFDRTTGEQAWTFDTGGEVDCSPVICGDRVLIGSVDGWFYMLSLEEGRKVWAYEIGGAVVASPAVAGDRVIVGGGDGYVYAFGPKP